MSTGRQTRNLIGPPAVLLAALTLFAVSLFPQAMTQPPPDSRAVIRHVDMKYTMPEFRTKEEWSARKESLRRQILVAAGLWPAPFKCPLNAQAFGRLERKGYSIEKVYFESYPGFFVTGNLYRPLGKSGPFPAVLSPHGHWAYGRLQNSELCSVPARCITLARQGFVVFSYDMVGYLDSRQVDHRIRGEREALWGFGSLGLHLWNSIRSVDFLESLEDVDRQRIACTGASGGGTQTFLLTAVDDRIATSAPVNMISAHMQGGDVCENAPNLRIDTNNMEIAAMMAPRPMLMVSATGDWTKDTLEIEFPAIRKIYRLLGVEDRLSAVQVRAEHNYNKESREHVYRWLARWMQGKVLGGAQLEKDIKVEFPPDLLVFYGRSLPDNAKSQSQLVEDYIRSAAAVIESLKPVDAETWGKFRDALGPALRYSLMAEYPAAGEVEAEVPKLSNSAQWKTGKFFLTRSGKADRVPVTMWLPGANATYRQGILLVHPRGSQAFEAEGAPGALVSGLLKKGSTVLAPDLFNTGSASWQRAAEYAFFTGYNRTDDANRVQDVLTSLAYLRSQSGSLPIKVVGFEKAGLWCLLARSLADDDAAFALDAGRFDSTSDAAFLRQLNIPGIRRAGDLRSAAILNVRSPLWVSNTGSNFPAEWITSVYRSMGKDHLLRLDDGPATEAEIRLWLAGALTPAK